MEPAELERWISAEPTGAFSRRAWFLYERLTGRLLDLPDAVQGPYVPALDPERHLTWTPDKPIRSRRHRVTDNLFGGPGLCPTVRLTRHLAELLAEPVAEEAKRLVDGCDLRSCAGCRLPVHEETRSSFEIEGEQVEETRTERFVRAIQTAAELFRSYRRSRLRCPTEPDHQRLRYHARGGEPTRTSSAQIGPGIGTRFITFVRGQRTCPP
jgi:hypothetical protein